MLMLTEYKTRDLFSKILSENIFELLSCNLKHFNCLISIVCLVLFCVYVTLFKKFLA